MKQANPWVGHRREGPAAAGVETKAVAIRAKPMRNNTILFFIEDSFQSENDLTAMSLPQKYAFG
jgi:hypothetical protein